MKCNYCPHPTMKRPKGYMSANVLEKCIKFHLEQGRNLLVLHHFGEPFLHPELEERLFQISDSGLNIQLSTNAVLIDKVWPILLKINCHIKVMISVHKWVKKGESEYIKAVASLKERSKGTQIEILEAYNFKQGNFTFHSWDEGLKQNWDVNQCPFIRQNFGVILWNGDIAACCVDYEGYTVDGNIMESQIINHVTKPWKACSTCDVGKLMMHEIW